MQAKKRYVLLFLSCAFLALFYLGCCRLKDLIEKAARVPPLLESYLDVAGIHDSFSPRSRRQSRRTSTATEDCTMETCFDFSRCQNGRFLVHVYPSDSGDKSPSPTYAKILNVIRESKYFTPDPSQACLFVLAIDTLDRDALSPDYVRGIRTRLLRLPHWNDGTNHLIFNFYSGTWPDYVQDLGFDIGRAVLARASTSFTTYRSGFDISLPLVHKEHRERGGDVVPFYTDNMPGAKNFLLAFKGKRYVYGIGSETRNSLHHLHNGNDIIMVTTCKHGKNWKELKDERCEQDNAQYDRYDYDVLLQNSTFCLVPRGRRLGSFRFVEVLQAGCVPVLLSNNWVLPFSEIIDWNSAAVFADERLLLQVGDIVRSVEADRILSMRQQAQLLWHLYFSSIDRIVYTTLEIVRERVQRHLWRDKRTWSNLPGGLVTLPSFSDIGADFPWSGNPQRPKQFTALLYVHSGSSGANLFKLVRTVSKSRFVHKILIIWASEWMKPPIGRWSTLLPNVPLQLVEPVIRENVGEKFRPLDSIETDAVFSLDEDIVVTVDEIDFAFEVWNHFPERIVGLPARAHFWDETKNIWGYTSKWTNEYSMILTSAAIYHRYYHSLYWDWLSPLLLKTVDQSRNCEDILLNFLVSHVTRQPPIKVAQRKLYINSSVSSNSPWNDPDHFVQRQACLNTFAAVFGYMPLIRSSGRFDPVLYKDPVSNLRKKYRQMELLGN